MLLVTHTCDPSYVGGGRGSHELEANYMMRLCLKITTKQRGARKSNLSGQSRYGHMA